MTTVILIIHIIISIAIVGLVLMQRSEGGGLGIGGGNNFMSARGTADFLTRATTFLAIAFFLYVNPLSNDCRIWKKNQFNS